jgi:predicted RNase H-like HicB family nuclease
MNDEVFERAKQLASRPYPFQIYKDEEGDDETRYLARNPDIEGCMAQGASQHEAIENLKDARVDLFEFLLERGEPIPEPRVLVSAQSYGVLNLTVSYGSQGKTIDEVLDSTVVSQVIEKDSRELQYEASLETLPVYHFGVIAESVFV